MHLHFTSKKKWSSAHWTCSINNIKSSKSKIDRFGFDKKTHIHAKLCKYEGHAVLLFFGCKNCLEIYGVFILLLSLGLKSRGFVASVKPIKEQLSSRKAARACLMTSLTKFTTLFSQKRFVICLLTRFLAMFLNFVQRSWIRRKVISPTKRLQWDIEKTSATVVVTQHFHFTLLIYSRILT